MVDPGAAWSVDAPVVPQADPHRHALVYAQAMVRALLREEAHDRRPKRLLEADRATWAQFRGRLTDTALVEILLEDAAIAQPIPFDASRLLGGDRPVQHIPVGQVHAWLEAPAIDGSPAEYIAAQAKLLGLPTRLGRSDLPVVKSHQRVLEIPGTGGQLTHHLLEVHPELPVREVFTIACGSWQELALAGLVCVEKGLQGEPPAMLDPKLDVARTRTRPFDFVFGVDTGLFSQAQLASWFPQARVVLV
jgi:hypothetical protein